MLKKFLKPSNSRPDKVIFNLETSDYLAFAVFSSIWVFLGWITFSMTLGNFFCSWIILTTFLVLVGFLFWQIIAKKISFKISREFLIVSLFILTFVVISSFFVTPTIFSGRDQGAISEAAVRLSENKKLEFSTPASEEFFKIYGPGKALNFPGFHYTETGKLATQFPLPYISWLASFYSFFGLTGIIIANSILLFIFLASFYLLARIFLKASYSIILIALTATSFPFFWFFKFTLSENMALALLWLSILWIVLFTKNRRSFFYYSFLISAGLLVFVRIEGIFFLISGFLTMFFLTKKDGFWEKKRKLTMIYPAIFLGIIFIINFFQDIYFYKEMAKAALNFEGGGSSKISAFQKLLSPMALELRTFLTYGVLSFLIIGILGIIHFLKENKWNILAPFFVVLPSLIYLFNPWISSDHPWMLRRFVFSIFPVFFFYSIFFLEKWTGSKMIHRKIISYFVLASMIAFNLFLFANYFPFSENKSLARETEKISENFSGKDLVLIDRMASGDGWSMITGPMNFLLGKNTAYIFNPKDIEKIDQSKFARIYLIVPARNVDFYRNLLDNGKMKFFKNYSIETEQLGKTSKIQTYVIPQKEKVKTTGSIFEIK